ncbi:MAG: hypothetical protein NVSMB52_00430 [Chloroflexota bacterium]
MIHQIVTYLIPALFVVVVALLAYGVYAFRPSNEETRSEVMPGRRVNMRLEVLWTGIASMLLLAVFLSAR